MSLACGLVTFGVRVVDVVACSQVESIDEEELWIDVGCFSVTPGFLEII